MFNSWSPFGLEVEELVDNYSYFLDNHELVLNDFLTYIKRKNKNYLQSE